MSSKKMGPVLILCLPLYLSAPGYAQSPGNEANPQKFAQQDENKDNVENRFKRQNMRIHRGVKAGTINKAQAAQLKSVLDELQARVDRQKQQNGGQLKPEQLKQAKNTLNQSSEQIRSFESAGSGTVESGKVLGPKWAKGQDGAQNSKGLLKEMKQEEKRELRQEKQANEQTLEQQQLDYEKQMMPKLGRQRKDILKQKQNLQKIRKESGAN